MKSVKSFLSKLFRIIVTAIIGDLRTAQTTRLWQKGIPQELGYESLAGYLADVPEIQLRYLWRAMLAKFLGLDGCVVLFDGRLRSLVKLCNLAGVSHFGDDDTLVPHGGRCQRIERQTWIYVRDGRCHRGRSASARYASFGPRWIEVDAFEGVFTYIAYPTVVSEYADGVGGYSMFLLGSVLRSDHDITVYLSMYESRVGIHIYRGGAHWPQYGAGSRLTNTHDR